MSSKPALDDVFGKKAARYFRLAVSVYVVMLITCCGISVLCLMETPYRSATVVALVATALTGGLTLGCALVMARSLKIAPTPQHRQRDTTEADNEGAEPEGGMMDQNPYVGRTIIVSMFGVLALLMMLHLVAQTIMGIAAVYK
jgi:hypothetical protein